ncbi:MAG: nucleoside hydrolase, partial [Verrucomicrobiota bacterium]|nr:nucleoside hydrolase [Verrucomicrobiota bacterium]
VYPGANSARQLGQRTAASEALAARLAHGSRLTYLALGPLTNLATLIQLHPEAARQIDRVVLLAGRAPAANPGFGPRGKFHIHDANVFKDPAAVEVLLASRIPVSLMPIDTAGQLRLRPGELRALRQTGAAGQFLSANSLIWMWFWTRFVGTEGAPVFDAAAVLAAAQPKLFRSEIRSAAISGDGNLVARQGATGTQREVRWYASVPPAAKTLFLARLRGRTQMRD